MKPTYEISGGPLAMYVFRGDREEAAAFALTHGGWTICRNTRDGYLPIAGGEFWSRAETMIWLEENFPGLREAI